MLTESSEPLYPFVFTHYPTHRSRIRNQSSGLISLRRRFALLLEMLQEKSRRNGSGGQVAV
ncbi:hypothetical protein FGI60_12350 [Brucella haematophila]|nr:hypothetical protein F9K79_15515 [Ochrobactrum sp. Kaboul]TMV03241.1 hypothetical protein FGI60_12350 [Brucella haematophila]